MPRYPHPQIGLSQRDARRPEACRWIVYMLMALACGLLSAEVVEAASLERLAGLVREHPDEAPLSWAYANALYSAGQTEEAIAELERFERRWPGRRPDSLLRIGRWYYEQESYANSRKALVQVLSRDAESAEGHLYLGLVMTRTGQPRQAVSQFELAGQLAPELAADSGLLAGIALIDAGDKRRAYEVLREVVRRYPNSEPARFARLVLGERAASGERYEFELYTGFEYDTNVPLDSSTNFGGLTTDQDDGRGVWGANASMRVWENESLDFRIGVRYDGIGHFDLNEFDTHRVNGYGSVMWRVSKRVISRLDGSVRYATLDGEPYLLSGLVRPSLLFDWGRRGGVTRLMLEVEPLDYRHDVLFVSLERDGVSFGGGFDHFWPIPKWKNSWLALGGNYRRLETEGEVDSLGFDSAYDHHRWRGVLAMRAALPWKLTADLSGAISGEYYDNRNLIFLLTSLGIDERDDLVYEAGVRLARPIMHALDVELSWIFVERDSNVPIYSYDRHVVALRFRVHPLRWWQGRRTQ